MNIRFLQRRASDWLATRGPVGASEQDQFDGIVEETGELAKARLKARQGIGYGGRTAADWEAKERDAIGDIVIFLSNYATMRGFDFGGCVEDAYVNILQRDWRKFPRNGRTE